MIGESDVLIVGAGPAGCAAALAATASGASVCVVDRARFPRDKTCGDAVSNDALALLRSLGVGDELERLPHALVRRAVAVLPDGSRIEREYPRPGWIVTRLAFDDCLRRAAQDRGARVLEGVAVRRLVPSWHAPGAEGDDFRWRARVVVAADGPGSLAWSALGQSKPSGPALAVSRTVYLRGVRSGSSDVSEHHFASWLPGGYAWLFPEVDGVSNVGVYQRLDHYRAAGADLEQLLARFLAEHRDRFESAQPLGPARTWSLPLAGPRMPSGGPGLLLAGDAARVVDPLTGEGIWHALASGATVGRSAAEAARRGGLTRADLLRTAMTLGREVAWPAASRRLPQDAMALLIRTGLHRQAWVKKALAWGYARGALEASKSVT